MSQTDIIHDLLTSNPNEPASNGVVLLLRTEMNSEFKTARQKLEQHDAQFVEIKDEMRQQFKSIHDSLEMIAQQMAIVVTKLN